MNGWYCGRTKISKPFLTLFLLSAREKSADVFVVVVVVSHEAFLSKPTHRIEYSLAYRVHLKGFVQDYNGIEADVLHLTSEFHDVIKPVCTYLPQLCQATSD